MLNYRLILILLILPAVLVSNCSKRQSGENKEKTRTKWEVARADLEYRRLQTDLSLAKAKDPYLVIDLRRMRLTIKLKGAIVWSEPLVQIEPDSSALMDFARHFETKDGQLVRQIKGKYLFAAGKKMSDSVLAIVGEAVNVDPNLLQREVPARFQINWADGLQLDIRTDINAKSLTPLKNALVEVKQALTRPFGETSLEIKMNPDEALTLYRVAVRGFRTMIYPPMPVGK